MTSGQERTVKTPSRNANVAAHQRRLDVIPGGVNSNVRLQAFPTPLTFTHGLGSRLWDIEGNEYVDFAMGMGPHILGHAPPAVTTRVQAAIARGQLFAGQTEEEAELAELLVNTLGWIEMVRFGLSGTEMDLLAVRVARAATGRQRVVRFHGHYHGWLDPLFVGPPASESSSFTLTGGQSLASAQDLIACEWNDLEAFERVIADHAHEIAVVMMEPIMCNTGVIDPLPGYLENVREICTKHGIILVIDEVITGFRVGLTGAQGQSGVYGDLTVYAKAIASGYPFAVLGGRADLMELIGGGGVNHSGTYNTGVVQLIAALATVEELVATNPYPALTTHGRNLADGINKIASSAGVDLICEGPGPMLQLRFGDGQPANDAGEFAAKNDQVRLTDLLRGLEAEGVRTTSRGLLFLSAAHTQVDVDLTLDAIERLVRAE